LTGQDGDKDMTPILMVAFRLALKCSEQTQKTNAAMMNAPETKIGFRPTLSTQMTAGIVAAHMTMPTTPVARREMVFPVRPRDWKMLGA
jgi:hypothetical protein